MRVDGNTINDGIHDFKVWFSDFTIELSPLLILAGMLMTGVDIYLSGRLATQIWFEVPWAIAQVLAIDGLWFAVWVRILDHSHSRKVVSWLRFLGMTLVGMAMVIVAFIMNDIVLFQQVNSLASSLGAMTKLGIPIALFTHFRAMLLVATATLAMLFSKRRRSPAPAISSISTVVIAEERRTKPASHSRSKATITIADSPSQKAIPEQSSISHSPLLGMIEQRMYDALMDKPEEARELLRLSQEQSIDDFTATLKERYGQYAGYITPQRVANVIAYARSHSPLLEATHSPKIVNRSLGSIALAASTDTSGDGYTAMEEKTNTHHRVAIVATGSQGYRDKIKAVWLQHLAEGREIKLTDIASEAGIGYSTVKKWASSIREEIEQATVTALHPAVAPAHEQEER